MPSSHCRGVRSARVSKCATCPVACTPASVRPAACTVTGSSATAETAAATQASIVRAWRCSCQPANAVPSYSMPIAIRGTGALRAQRIDQALRLAALARVAFVEHFLEDAARAFGIAHVDVRAREIELRADLGHRLRIERLAAVVVARIEADVEIDRRIAAAEHVGTERPRLLHRVAAVQRGREVVEIEVDVVALAQSLHELRIARRFVEIVAPR